MLVKTSKRYNYNCYATVKIEEKENNNKYLYTLCENIYGKVGDKNIDYESCLFQFGLIPKKYKNTQKFDINQLTNFDNDRELYLNNNIFSIDSKETKDIDDAISIEEDKNIITLYIHIADASYFAMRDKNIFKNASENISSFYLFLH